MDLKEKMNLVFNEELEKNEILTMDEKKVLASLLYSYKICTGAKNGELIRSMASVRKDANINMTKLYDVLHMLEHSYGMIERIPGKERKLGEKSIASKFIFHFDKIFNPPKEHKKFSFLEELKSSETPFGKVNINTNTKLNTNTNIDTKLTTDTVIIEDTSTDEDIKEKLETNTLVDTVKLEKGISKDEEEKKSYTYMLNELLRASAKQVEDENRDFFNN